jgi:hypothetical protein
MNTLPTLPQVAEPGTRALATAYTELLLNGAQADPVLGAIVLVHHHDDDDVRPLHRGILKTHYYLSETADNDSIAALVESLRELYEANWLTPAQVHALLELAARSEDLTWCENQVRIISLAADGSAQLAAYGTLIRFERNWWTIAGSEGCAPTTCPRLESAVNHARLLRRSFTGKN